MTYPEKPGYVRGSDTSEAAAGTMVSATGTMRAQVLEMIRNAPNGMTCNEVEIETGWVHQSASARIREVALSGLIKDSGCRRPGRSGRQQRVYIATKSGPSVQMELW